MRHKLPATVVLLFIMLTLVIEAGAQPFTLNVTVSNQPDNPIILGWISGDDFHKIDSAKAFNGAVKFLLPSDANPGVYRLVLGKTGYARVMNDDPQTLDFIFNNENIDLQTDFKAPFEALKVNRSKENQLYFDFMQRKKEYEKALLIMEKQLDQIWNRKDTAGCRDNQLHTLQGFKPALRLPGLGRLGAEAIDIRLDVGDFALLFAVLRLLVRQAFAANPLEGRVVAAVELHALPLDIQDLADDAVEEIAVM